MALKMLRQFIHLESCAGFVLFFAAILAIIIANTPWHLYEQAILAWPFGVSVGHFSLEKPVFLWINEGLMSIFFLLVGLEIKRELCEGELSTVQAALLPAIAALGGMLMPALFYGLCNSHHPQALRGWAIPVATDIAFSLAIVSLLGARVPPALKAFLTALAIFDDIGAILIIAIFYTHHLAWGFLMAALILMLALVLLNRFKVTRLAPYYALGAILWVCVLESGIHATLVGIFLALVIPLPSAKGLEKALHPWVAFLILPIFALANAGISFSQISSAHLFSSVPLGIAGGLFLGKQIGVFGFTRLAIACGFAKMPAKMTNFSLYGVALVAGVGFTMSLFIGGLAFGHADLQQAAYVRMGVVLGSILAGTLGYFVLKCSCHYSVRK